MNHIKNSQTIIVPAFNEENLLMKSVTDLNSALNSINIPHEILIVENGSTDNTAKIAQKISSKNPQIKTLSLQSPNYGEALKEGILKSDSEIVSIVNVDYWNADFIKQSQDLILGSQKYDFIVGSKHLKDNADKRGLGKKLMSSGFNYLLKILFNFRGTDTHGQKTFLKSKILPIVKSSITSDFVFDTELVLRASALGLKIKELPLEVEEVRPRRYSNFSQVIKTMQNIILLYWNIKMN